MTSVELFKACERLIVAFPREDGLLAFLNDLDYEFQELSSLLEEFFSASDQSKFASLSASANVRASETITKCKAIKPRELFKMFDSARAALGEFSDVMLTPWTESPSVMSAIDEVADAYESFLVVQDRNRAFRLTLRGSRAFMVLHTLLWFAEALRNQNAERYVQPQAGEALFSLSLSAVNDVESMAAKLQALHHMYAEICALMKLGEAASRLRIARVESGSTIIEVLGNAGALAIIAAAIKAGAGYLYRNYTGEGRTNEIPRKVEIAESVLGLADKLKERGINTSKMDEYLAKSSTQIARDLNQLLSDEDIIEINGVPQPVTPTGQSKLLTGGKVSLLQDEAKPADSDADVS
jgi:hypothetical protein